MRDLIAIRENRDDVSVALQLLETYLHILGRMKEKTNSISIGFPGFCC